MANAPIVSWYEGTNDISKEVKTTVNFQTVDADSDSPTKKFFIWNNRPPLSSLDVSGNVTKIPEDCSKMEDVVFTTRDRLGGTGDSPIVEAVRDNWFQVKVVSLNETSFTPVGKGGVGTPNPLGTKALGTNGTTTNPYASTAIVWSPSAVYVAGDYVQPTTPNGFIYKVVVGGTTDGTQPDWATVDANPVYDGTVEYISVKIDKTPASQEILGLANATKGDGSNANLAGGNFVEIDVFARVPVDASAGKNLLMQRVSYKYV